MQRNRPLGPLLFLLAWQVLVPGPAQGVDYVWIGPDEGIWEIPSYWDPNGVPGAPWDVAWIDNRPQDVHVNMRGSRSMYGIIIDAGDRLTITGGVWIDLRNGATITNNGLFTMNGGGAFLKGIGIAATIQGIGELVFGGDGNNLLLEIITNGSGHTIRGAGRITGTFTNHGNVLAEGGTLRLEAPVPNDGLLSTLGGGVLWIGDTVTGGTIDQGPGTVTLQDGGLRNVLVGSGTLQVIGGNEIVAGLTLPAGSQLALQAASYADLKESAVIVNDGLITLGGGGAFLKGWGGSMATLQGTGAVVLGGDGNNSLQELITNGSGHTVRGAGAINGTFINHGSVLAEGGTLWIQTPTTSDGLLSTLGGGVLRIGSTVTGGTIQQGPGTVNLQGGGLRNAQIGSGTTLQVIGENQIFAGLTLPAGSQLALQAGSYADLKESAVIVNDGLITLGGVNASMRGWAPMATLQGSGEVVLGGDGNNTLWDYITNSSGHTIRGAGAINGTFTNDGLVIADVPGRTLSFPGGSATNNGTIRAATGGTANATSPLTNNGVAEATGGGVFRASNIPAHYSGGTLTGGTWQVFDNSTMRLIPADIQTLSASILLDGPNSSLYRDDATTNALASLNSVTASGRLEIRNGRALATPAVLGNAGTVIVGAASSLAVAGAYTQTAGLTTVNGILTASGVASASGGWVNGSGTVAGNLTNAAGVAPGTSAGVLTIEGEYVQGAAGSLLVELGGPGPGESDRLAVVGTATLDGELQVALLPGFTPSAGDSFEVLTFASRVGMFASYQGLDLGGGLSLEPVYSDTNLVLAAVQQSIAVEEPVLPAPYRLSARLTAEGAVTFDLDMPEAAEVELKAYDVRGRHVAVLAEGPRAAGRHAFRLGADGARGALASGIYFARATLRASEGDRVLTVRAVLVR